MKKTARRLARRDRHKKKKQKELKEIFTPVPDGKSGDSSVNDNKTKNKNKNTKNKTKNKNKTKTKNKNNEEPKTTDDDDDDDDDEEEDETDSGSEDLSLEDEKEDKNQPEWKRYWTEKELNGRYTPIKELGRGSYGVVYEGVSNFTDDDMEISVGTKVAIKKVRRVFNTNTDAKRLLRELRILTCLHGHPSLVMLYDILPPVDPLKFGTVTIVFEYVDADLSKIFKTNQFFSDLHVQYMMYHLILGVNYMHSAGIVHRDLKPANVLINADCSIKICDFGLARGFSEDFGRDKKTQKEDAKKLGAQRGLTTHVVTRWYRAPEVILLQQRKDYITAVDMWSVGCIFAELLQMQRENCATVWKRGPFLPGDSCFPLSPKQSKKKKIYQSHFDQIRVIFDVLGSPTNKEIEALNDEQARAYLHDLPKKQPQNLQEMFPGTSKEGIHLLKNLLIFDVKKRMSVKEALKHPYFTRVRDVELENARPFHRFAFEDVTLKTEELRSLILEEVCTFHPKNRDQYIKKGAIVASANAKLKAKNKELAQKANGNNNSSKPKPKPTKESKPTKSNKSNKSIQSKEEPSSKSSASSKSSSSNVSSSNNKKTKKSKK